MIKHLLMDFERSERMIIDLKRKNLLPNYKKNTYAIVPSRSMVLKLPEIYARYFQQSMFII